MLAGSASRPELEGVRSWRSAPRWQPDTFLPPQRPLSCPPASSLRRPSPTPLITQRHIARPGRRPGPPGGHPAAYRSPGRRSCARRRWPRAGRSAGSSARGRRRSAAQACAGYATYAGWTNNATNDDLVTASAICVAESGGQPTVYYCNPTGQDGYYPPVSCSGMYDRGLWQIDNQAWTSITDTCAFTAKCNADGAYTISQRRRELFSLGHVHQRDLLQLPDRRPVRRPGAARWHAAQRPGRRLPVPGGLHPERPAITSACGSGTGRQQWRMAGRAIRDGTYCLAVASAGSRAAVHLRRCNGSSYQQWTALGNGLLRNALGEPVPARPGQHSHPGNPGQRGLVHPDRVPHVVAAVRPVRPPAVPRPAARSAPAVPRPAARIRLAGHGTAL